MGKKRRALSKPRMPRRHERALWLITAFVAGGLIMSLEMVAFRLYAPYFGYSIYVWGTMISLVMAALAGGYALGGHLADRRPGYRGLYRLVLFSGLYQLVILLVVFSLLPAFADYGEVGGTMLATLVVFTPPVIGLAAVGPFVVKLLARIETVGVTAGRVYALSTIGSIAGILITSFVLVPEFGTRMTLQITCAVSIGLGVAGLAIMRRAAVASLAVLVLLPLASQPTWSGETIWAEESVYNLVRVVRQQGRNLLVLNHEASVHSLYDPVSGWTHWYWDDFALGPLLVDAESVLVLGMGAGSSISASRRVDPNLRFDAVEIDPMVVEAGHRFFDLPRQSDWLRVHLADARPWLLRSTATYDIIQVDLYHGGAYVPFYLMTEEFFGSVADHLAPGGVVLINVFDVGRDKQLLNALGATLSARFPTVMVRSRRAANHLVLAFAQERSLASIQAQLDGVRGDPEVEHLAREARDAIRTLAPPPGTRALTDDWAPIEAMTRRMLDEYRAQSEAAEGR